MQTMEYNSPFGDGVSVTRHGSDGSSGDPPPVDAGLEAGDDEFTITSVGDGMEAVTQTGSSELAESMTSPIERRIADSRWSRDDIELAIRMLGLVATMAALYATYHGGR